MESKEFEELLSQARYIGGAARTLYKDVTGEDLDLESAVKHYPVLILALAVSAGGVAGWWLGRKGQDQPQLPPPAEEGPRRTLDFIEEALPGAVERVRERLPEIVVSDAVKARARMWMANVVEEQLRQNVDTMVDKADARLTSFFRRATQRLEPDEDVKLDYPDELGEPPR